MDILTVAQVAERMSLSNELIAKYCREGRLAGAELRGRIWLIPAASVVEFEDAHDDYAPGRPRKLKDGWVLWREGGRKVTGAAKAAAFAVRAPSRMPENVSRRDAEAFASLGRTKAERTARKAMIDALYGR